MFWYTQNIILSPLPQSFVENIIDLKTNQPSSGDILNRTSVIRPITSQINLNLTKNPNPPARCAQIHYTQPNLAKDDFCPTYPLRKTPPNRN